MCRNTANNKNFQYRIFIFECQRNQGLNFSIILKNTLFGPFPHFWGEFFFFFPKNTALSHTTLYGFLTLCQNLELMIQLQENVRTEGRKQSRRDPILLDVSGYRWSKRKFICIYETYGIVSFLGVSVLNKMQRAFYWLGGKTFHSENRFL